MPRIGFISPYRKLADMVTDLSEQVGERISVKIGDGNEAVDIANKMIEKGIEAIISRGGTAQYLKEALSIPVIEIPITPVDIIKAIKKFCSPGGKIALCGYDNIISGLESVAEIVENIEIIPVILRRSETMEQIMAKIHEIVPLVDCVVGDAISVREAKRLGKDGVLIESGTESILSAILEAQKLLEVAYQERAHAEELQAILNYSQEGIISVDQKGTIRFVNGPAESLFDVHRGSLVGTNIHHSFPYVNYKKVMTDGEPLLEQFVDIGNKTLMFHTIPIKIKERVTGAVSVFVDISNIRKQEEKIRERIYLKGHVARYTFDQMIVGNDKMQDLIDISKRYAKTSSNILIYGETGTGKEFFAQSIHNASQRKEKPFVAVNCAALPDHLLESELFGYEEGAFTGAKKGGKIGLFELAHEGTIFLDEISETSLPIQVKLLRVIQEKQVMRLGGERLIPVDVRIIAATNQDLGRAVRENRFRADLFYRLHVLTLKLLPLRERIDAIPYFIDEFIGKYCRENGLVKKNMTKEAIEALQTYEWAGNVRELENCIERLTVLVRGEQIRLHHVRNYIDDLSLFTEESGQNPEIRHGQEHVYYEAMGKQENSKYNVQININKNLKDIEDEIIRKMVDLNGGNQAKAARALGIGRSTIWRRNGEQER